MYFYVILGLRDTSTGENVRFVILEGLGIIWETLGLHDTRGGGYVISGKVGLRDPVGGGYVIFGKVRLRDPGIGGLYHLGNKYVYMILGVGNILSGKRYVYGGGGDISAERKIRLHDPWGLCLPVGRLANYVVEHTLSLGSSPS